MSASPYLDRIHATNDIKSFTLEELPPLAEDIRRLIMDVVMKNGGHLGSNLGVVDLTLALHYVFDVTQDLIVWDGTYQTYAHKILTGRKERFPTLRRQGGICGFGWKAESPTDPFNFGHVGAGPAVAHGAALADARTGRNRKVVSIIGDGSMTSGVAFEALNNIGASRQPLLMILNDNGFSISKTVGAISKYFSELRTAPAYAHLKHDVQAFLHKIPLGTSVEHTLDSIRRGLKQALFPNIFTALGFQYYGPIDGHDLPGLVRLFRNVRDQKQPVLLHVITQKGLGHPDATTDPFALHKHIETKKPPARNPVTESKVEPDGKASPAASRSYTRAFIDSLTDLSRKNDRIVAITAAMPDGTGLLDYAKVFPDRMYDAGISEQCAIALASGMAESGLQPVVAIYSSFVQRGYDQIFQEVCLNHSPVVLVLDRGGVAGEDGPTHHGNFDIAFLRTFPNMTLLAPADGEELHAMLEFALALRRPVAIRIPRENVPDLSSHRGSRNPIVLGKGELLAEGKGGAILAYGAMVAPALQAREMLKREGLEITVANARFAKPVDVELASQLVAKHPFVLTVEDHAANGGFGSAVLEALSLRNEETSKIKIHAIPDRFLQHAERVDLLRTLHLDAQGMADAVRVIAAGRAPSTLVPTEQGDIFYNG